MKITDETDGKVALIPFIMGNFEGADHESLCNIEPSITDCDDIPQKPFKKKSYRLFTVKNITLALMFNLVFVITMNLALSSIKTDKEVHTKTNSIQSYLYISRKKVAPIDSHDAVEAKIQKETSKSVLVSNFSEQENTAKKTTAEPPSSSNSAKRKQGNDSVSVNTKKQQTVQSLPNIKDITRSYLSRQKAAAITDSAKMYANEQTDIGTLSEMTPTVQPLWTPEAEKEEDKKIIHNKLDPKRIVKEGHICKRVIQVGDPLDPHAEILGYPFKCGQTDLEKAYNQAMQKRQKR